MKKLFYLVSAFILISACEKLTIDCPAEMVSYNLSGSYRLDRIENTRIVNGKITSKQMAYEYINDGYHDYTTWEFGQNNIMFVYCNKWADNGVKWNFLNDPTPYRCSYRIEGKNLLFSAGEYGAIIWDGIEPDSDKYTIDKVCDFIENLPVTVVLSYNAKTFYNAQNELITIKRTVYLISEN